MTANRHIHQLEYIGMMFVGFAFAALVVLVIARMHPAPPPVEWLEYTSIDGAHCPGAVVPYSAVIRVKQAGPIYVVSSIMRADDNSVVLDAAADEWAQEWMTATGLPVAGDTIIGQRLGTIFVTVIADSDVLFLDRDFSFIVPDIPPGRYVRNVAAGVWGRDSEAAIRSQPFTVAADCE